MRPFRFILLLAIFVALPIALTCWSLFTAVDSAADSFHAGYNTRSSRLRSLFSFSTPSSLFPPSAVISLTNDNSTFFLARPAAFGPSLPSRGLSGQLWVGKGFGDDSLLKEESIHVAGWELGCSDVPGWGESVHKHLQRLHPDYTKKKSSAVPRDLPASGHSSDAPHDGPDHLSGGSPEMDDGTDDYLHHPLQDSNPATPGSPGEPADVDHADKTKQPTHADIESLQESAAIAGKVVMLARGGCGFLEKVKWAQRRGGIALIVGDNERGAQLTIMYARGDTSNVTIPALFTSYTSAHLLSSLVPAEDKDEMIIDGQKTQPTTDKVPAPKPDDSKPVFTSTKAGTRQPTNVAASNGGDSREDGDTTWIDNILSAIGLSDNSAFTHAEDSRRPPSSGNIDWVLLEDWDDDQPADLLNKPQTTSVNNRDVAPTPSPRPKTTTSRRVEGDDFVIGVQDWRDADLVAPRPTPGSGEAPGKPKNGKEVATETPNRVKPSSTPGATLEGGSITPGSGEYNHVNSNQASNRPQRGNRPKGSLKPGKDDEQPQGQPSEGSWLDFFKSDEVDESDNKRRPAQDTEPSDRKNKGGSSRKSDDEDQLEGLWVTLTPTSVSTNPFFDTLLVLVVSPLVTLTVVYALLLLRSRIRRRRWRAPKSVVERLPVRTYHTMTTTSSTTSSQIAAPEAFSPTSPLLISTSQDVSRRPTNQNRTRSQTTIGVFPSASVDGGLSQTIPRSPSAEKTTSTSKYTKRKRYTGRQVECVVCLEEYVDGESQVMSLPCGHEFHVDCITPWLVTRRRTCPICKGDVVRSLARANSARWEDDTLPDEQTSDDVQSRAAQTTNDEPSAAIPIPVRLEEDRMDDDVEQGRDVETPLLGGSHTHQGDRHGQPLWRNIVSASVSRLSGDTLWRQASVDRNR